MKNIQKGDYIITLDSRTRHIVESIENIDSNIVVFTEDSKCFPIKNVEKTYPTSLGNYFYKLLTNQKISKQEEEEAQTVLNNLSSKIAHVN